MQVVTPIDVEDALRRDLAAILPAHRCFAPPAPDDLKAGDVMVTALGGTAVTHAVIAHDVAVDCWGHDEAEAAQVAATVSGAIGSLPLLDGTETEWKTARANAPYVNPDPKRPTLPRYSFNAEVSARGRNIDFES